MSVCVHWPFLQGFSPSSSCWVGHKHGYGAALWAVPGACAYQAQQQDPVGFAALPYCSKGARQGLSSGSTEMGK